MVVRPPHAHPMGQEPEQPQEPPRESLVTAALGMAALVILFVMWFVVLAVMVPA